MKPYLHSCVMINWLINANKNSLPTTKQKNILKHFFALGLGNPSMMTLLRKQSKKRRQQFLPELIFELNISAKLTKDKRFCVCCLISFVCLYWVKRQLCRKFSQILVLWIKLCYFTCSLLFSFWRSESKYCSYFGHYL